MSLQKQIIPVNFNGGLDTKTAEQLVMPGSFLVLENCVRRKSMRTQMRYGFNNLGTSIAGTSYVVNQGRKLDTFISDLLLLNDTNMYSYTSSADNWVDRGEISSVLVDAYPVIRNSDIQTMADMANDGRGLTVTAWEDSRGGVRCSVYNDETRAGVISDGIVSTTGSRPKVVSLDAYFLITYYDANSLKCRRVAKANPNILLPEQTVEGGNMSDNPYDLVNYDGYSAVVVYSAVGLSVTVGYIDKNGIAGSPAVNGLPSNKSFSIQARSCINVIVNPAISRIYIHTHDPSNDVVNISMMSAEGLIRVTQAVTTISGVRNITGVQLPDNSTDVYFEVAATSVKNHYIKAFNYTTTTNTLTAGSVSIFKRSVGLIAKAFLYNGVSYVTASHESGLQPTFFTIKSNGNTITRMLSGTGGGLSRDPFNVLKSGLSRTSLDESGKYIFALSIRTRVRADRDGTILATNIGINKASLSFGNTAFNSAQLGLNYHLAGGILTAYDGVSPVEHGFHIFPEDLSLTTTGSGGSISPGSYLVRAIYEWVDGKGQVHRSIPSTAIRTSATTNDTFIVTVPTLRLTQKTGFRSNAKIVLFRTLANGEAVYYRDVEITNDPTVDTVTVNLIQSDASLGTKEILYTTGGILDNAPAPASKVAHKHKNRLFIAGLEDENSVAFSKYQTFGEGTAFADEFRLPVDPLGGGITALSSLDDKLIIFKKDRSFYLSGDGPLDTGAQSDYGIPQLISADVGCAYPKSTVITPLGVMFKSDKGIYLLDRGLSTKYIGAPVERFNNLEITSGILIEDSNEVRFTTRTGVCLVYNYFFNQWSTFTNYQSISATNALAATTSIQSYLHLQENGTVGREILNQFNDNGQQIKMAIETTWFSFSGLQGYQRIYRYMVLGDLISNHTTVIKLAYNFEKFYTETVYFNTKTGLIETIFGSDTVFGESTPFGGSGSGVYQFRSKPAIQKCESIKIRLENLDNIELLPGGCFNLVNIAFEIGQKQSGFKFGDNENIGSV